MQPGKPVAPNAQIIEYDTKRYPFKRVLESCVYRIPELAKLHRYWQKQKGSKSLDYRDNLRLRKLMQRLPDDSAFYKVYHHWVTQEISPRFAHRIRYTQHPKMRVHLAGTESVSQFHRDALITNRPEQINVYLPFTDVTDGATVWCETDYYLGQYQPINLKYGQAYLWDGGYLEHGTFENDTDLTRVSCDFRFHSLSPEKVDYPWSHILAGRPVHQEKDLQQIN